MNITDIAFPNLGIYLENVPKSFTIFGFSIALYGVIIACGMIAGISLAGYVAKKHGYSTDMVWDFAIYGIVFGIIGARVYFVLFDWKIYKDNLLDIFKIRNGGLAIYGAVIAAFLTLFIYTRIKKMNFFTMGDICVPGLALGQAIGRWGNFCNREAFGQYTDNLLAMRLPIDAVRSNDISTEIAAHIGAGENFIQVHPTFFYESMWNLILVVLMVLLWKYKRFEGEICLIYLGGYGLGRAWIEGLRTDQLLIPGTEMAVSQVLAVLLLIFALGMEIYARKIKNNLKKI